ncbi:hypothetical protein NKH19_29140 [Mesorhizobium sp. M1338]|uniref:hypothetical protein n=1 Tax=unclassified Mesorhizobium TaxID=325217 RepID=UPI0033373636
MHDDARSAAHPSGRKSSLQKVSRPRFPRKAVAKISRGKEVHAPVAKDTHLCGLLPGRNFSRQIPRNFEARSHLAHGGFLPVLLLHCILLFCQPEGAGHIVGAIAGDAMARPLPHKWTNERLGTQTAKKQSNKATSKVSSFPPLSR